MVRRRKKRTLKPRTPARIRKRKRARGRGGHQHAELTGLAFAAWAGVCAFLLLRDHAAAWALFGILAFGGRVALELLGQPAAADRTAGAVAVLLLAAVALALLAGRRPEAPPPGASRTDGFSVPEPATALEPGSLPG